MAATGARCIHGIDDRFCAVCNKATSGSRPRRAIATPTLDDVLRFLSGAQVRATYGAVAQLLGVSPTALGARLGHRRPEASWIVSAENGLPTGYTQNEMHPELVRSSEIITSATALAMRMAAWTPTPKR